MAVVTRALAGGGNPTDADLAAGFASSAHPSSAFMRVFGLSASSLLALGVHVDLSGDDVLSVSGPAQPAPCGACAGSLTNSVATAAHSSSAPASSTTLRASPPSSAL